MEGNVSEIRLFAADFAPKYWAYCAGQLLAINTNNALFSLLGTTYGGNGIQTFALPDFRGRAPMGTGQSPSVPSYVLGQRSGAPTVTALLSNLPSHTHVGTGSYSMGALSDGGDVGTPTGNNLAALTGLYSVATPDTALRAITPTITVGVTGNNLPIPVQQPYLGLNYIICLYGVFPSRN
ncbi:phage tail protein [Flavobacterium pectinovorum]|jgi:microcystin-dependent protein|uniref:Phage tail protein n=1 Tax=Flavobacterium pectinovorum TaxID=29533 RepID=A0A502EUQ8_9FLAO|nr:tail fiber protein [Flavobacterium pectinovorum]TPG40842.1 phage tail protein [Flavobacterium pectinovorum]